MQRKKSAVDAVGSRGAAAEGVAGSDKEIGGGAQPEEWEADGDHGDCEEGDEESLGLDQWRVFEGVLGKAFVTESIEFSENTSIAITPPPLILKNLLKKFQTKYGHNHENTF